MWVAMILACGTLNGEISTDCRSFGPNRNVSSEQQCRMQVLIGSQVVLKNNWTMVDWYCFNWADKPDAKIKGEPT